MSEQTQQSGSSQQTVADKLGYVSRSRPRIQGIDCQGNKGIVLPYETYQKSIGPQLTLNQELKDNKDYKKIRKQSLAKRNEILAQSRQQSYAPLMDLIGKNKDIQFKKMWSNQPSFDEYKKSRNVDKYKNWQGTEESINGEKFPEFVVRDDNGFIQSVDGLRITVPIKRQRVTKYFSENPTQAERQEKRYKQWKEEDKPADSYRHFIKNYLSPFLKERSYTVVQVYSVIGGRIWKEIIAQWQRDNLMMKLIQVGYAAFWKSESGEISQDTNDDGDDTCIIPTEKAVKESKQKSIEKRAKEQRG
ncbi:MAG: hypothetical protein EZS28_014631 [Streblomastix strix]|uniref:Uncharacterized protein n=1 Tax=Streblomastix strix TaxID=222440 RepID=A0A5J4W522_9EUKA|nr:MAG: hypothetical protein EZS28_014631 [Streblomastix strix]